MTYSLLCLSLVEITRAPHRDMHFDALAARLTLLATVACALPPVSAIVSPPTRGELSSPHGDYPTETQQVYRVQVPSGLQINVTIDAFSMDAGRDYLEVYDGREINTDSLVGNYSGALPVLPMSLVTTNNHLTLRFTSNGSVQKSSWHLMWAAI